VIAKDAFEHLGDLVLDLLLDHLLGSLSSPHFGAKRLLAGAFLVAPSVGGKEGRVLSFVGIVNNTGTNEPPSQSEDRKCYLSQKPHRGEPGFVTGGAARVQAATHS
jgi:hypothetical protein